MNAKPMYVVHSVHTTGNGNTTQPMFLDEAVEPNNPQGNDWDNFEKTKGDLNANMDYEAKQRAYMRGWQKAQISGDIVTPEIQ